ncbi:MAG: uroporphyrinogen-III synthase [Calditrichia bacterium]
MSLFNKRIVICRRREQARELVKALQQRKAWPVVFPTFEVNLLPPQMDVLDELGDLSRFAWLVFGSENGVRFFRHWLEQMQWPAIRERRVAMVGKKTAAAWNKLFPNIPVSLQENYLQAVLDKLAAFAGAQKIPVLNPTSLQSLEKVQLQVPQEIDLWRLPVYSTNRCETNAPEEIDFVRSGQYDTVYFGSPTSFEFFLDIVGAEPLKGHVAIAVSGKTTAAFIAEKGFKVDILPASPNQEDLLAAMEQYFEEQVIEGKERT